MYYPKVINDENGFLIFGNYDGGEVKVNRLDVVHVKNKRLVVIEYDITNFRNSNKDIYDKNIYQNSIEVIAYSIPKKGEVKYIDKIHNDKDFRVKIVKTLIMDN